MARGTLSASWYRVAGLRPRLRPQAEIHRQRFRGQTWYVLQDHQTGRFHRVAPAANLMLCLMDGRRTMGEILGIVGRRFGDDRPTEEETIRLLSQLHQADLIQGEMPPDMAELARRDARQGRQSLIMRLKSPLALRFPLWDPDAFLERTLWLARPLVGRFGLVLWLLLLCAGAATVLVHWAELTHNAADRVLSAGNLVLMALLFPAMKLLHEMGHAYATKSRGGEVHELGVMMLVLVPVPYVDASSSSAFRSKWSRAAVASAGIMTELALAAVAALAWAALEPGLLRAICWNVMVIGGVSALLFNGNPLLRYDGYYVLADLIEIPNLDTRSKRYVTYLVQRHLLGIAQAVSPVTGPGERGWLLGYAVLAFAYRTVVMLAIGLFVASTFFAVGVAIAIWGVVQMLVLPLLKALRFALTSPQLRRRRLRAVAVTGGLVAGAAALLFALPVPHATVATGVVALPERAVLRIASDGFVAALHARPGEAVAAGQPLVELEDPVLAARAEVLRAELAVLEHRFTAVNLIDRVQARLVREQIGRAEAQLALAEQRRAGLGIAASHDGRLVLPEESSLPGRFLRQGDVLGYVIGAGDPAIRVVVPETAIDLVRGRTGAIAVRLGEDPWRTLPATPSRETPAAVRRLPNPALGPEGGGPVPLDPRARERDVPLGRFFEVQLALPEGQPVPRVGGKVQVRFDHGTEPLGLQALRAGRQVFLRTLGV
jgi:putative peptide zinc metalloprotease protein